MQTNVVNQVWEALSLGASKRKHPFHILNLAYVGETAECCSVVLRAYQDGRIRFHTHKGAPKVAAMRNNPHVCLMGYDPEIKMQVRIKGLVKLHHQDAESANQWEEMRDSSKHCYQLPAPGGIYQDPPSPQVLQANLQANPLIGRDNLVVGWVEIKQVDVLFLHFDGHQRFIIQKQQQSWDIQQIQA